jgi:hypothetical protein
VRGRHAAFDYGSSFRTGASKKSLKTDDPIELSLCEAGTPDRRL